MKPSPLKRMLALIGVALILILIILTIVFLAIGNAPLAITFVAINGFISIVLFFTLRFHNNAVEANRELTQQSTTDNDTTN